MLFDNSVSQTDANPPIHQSWIRQLKTEEERVNFKKTLLASRHVLRRLREILEEERNRLANQETSDKDFEDPNWSHKQAYRNGERKGLKYVEDLLHFL